MAHGRDTNRRVAYDMNPFVNIRKPACLEKLVRVPEEMITLEGPQGKTARTAGDISWIWAKEANTLGESVASGCKWLQVTAASGCFKSQPLNPVLLQVTGSGCQSHGGSAGFSGAGRRETGRSDMNGMKQRPILASTNVFMSTTFRKSSVFITAACSLRIER